MGTIAKENVAANTNTIDAQQYLTFRKSKLGINRNLSIDSAGKFTRLGLIDAFLSYSLAVSMTSLIIGILKIMVGRPRPDFINRCWPSSYEKSFVTGLPIKDFPTEIFSNSLNLPLSTFDLDCECGRDRENKQESKSYFETY